jgi:hypothetical protein
VRSLRRSCNECIEVSIRRVPRDVDAAARRAYLLAMTQLQPVTGRSTTMFHARTVRIVTLAAVILAFSATAAQARPLGLGYTDNSQSQSGDVWVIRSAQSQHHGFQGGPARTPRSGAQTISPAESALHGYQGPVRATLARAAGVQIMSPAVDPANAQQVPVVVTQAQPVATTDSGFNWTAALFGAGIATVVLLLAGATASRIRPRRVAQL